MELLKKLFKNSINYIISTIILTYAYLGNELAANVLMFLGWLAIIVYIIIMIVFVKATKEQTQPLIDAYDKQSTFSRTWGLLISLAYIVFFIKTGSIITAVMFAIALLIVINLLSPLKR